MLAGTAIVVVLFFVALAPVLAGADATAAALLAG